MLNENDPQVPPPERAGDQVVRVQEDRAASKRRGSVLIFTVLLLVLLAGIGTAFVMFVNLEYAASGNALRNTQSRAAAETGLEHARSLIRESLLLYRFETPDGFFHDMVGATRPYIDETAGLFRSFEYHPGITTVAGADAALTNGMWSSRLDFAWLYWNKDVANCGVASLDGAASGTPHTTREITDHAYTESPLAHFAYPNGQVRTDRSNGIEHAGLARRFLVYAPVLDFYASDLSKAVAPYRGEYYVWVTDLDSKLYAPYSGVAWGMTDASDVNQVMKCLSAFGYSASPTPGWRFDSSGTYRLGLTDAEITAMTARPGNYASTEDLAASIARTPPPSASGDPVVWDHLYYRFGLERYLTCWADNQRAVKGYETALNVNTASYEVLTAALSRIPLVDGATIGDATNLTKASYLAKRICAKRPFICRIDFEDFLAAHLNANAAGPEEDPRLSPQTPEGMIYAAIPKRQYVDLASVVTPPLVTLTLAQLMETPVQDTDTRYAWLRDPLKQQARFLWFRAADASAPLFTDATNNAFLSVKGFNNILNSISGQLPSGGYGYSFYSADGVHAPFPVSNPGPPPTVVIPKFEYNELTNPISAGLDTYVVERGDTSNNTETGELAAWRPTNTTGYYEMVFSLSDDAQIYEYAKLIPITRPVPPVPVPVISGGANGILETPAVPDDVAGTTSIDDPATGSFICDSTIHAPLRAYRHSLDDALTAPTANTDVSWSPRFCFRSRFFKVYVLARSIVTLKGDGTPVYGPASRLEAVYDAFDDKVLWRRWQATELRRVSDPVP